MLSLRLMTEDDLPAVEAWMRLPHVARWWLSGTTAEQEIAKYRRRINETSTRRTIMLTVTWAGDAIGWCQWYRWADYPGEATAMGARAGEIGIDYAIGAPAWIGRGAGTVLIAALVAEGDIVAAPEPLKSWDAGQHQAAGLADAPHLGDGGHVVPQSASRYPRILGRTATMFDGPAEIWRFFARQPLRR